MESAGHTLADVIDVARLQRVCDGLSAAGGVVLAVLDPGGRILVASGWQDICTRFHRLNAGSEAGCLESDLRINQRILSGLDAPEHIAYKCANGLWDVAFPLVVDGEHLANVFTGQFFYDDDEIDENVFRARAAELGFDEEAYLEALRRVPIVSHEHVEQTIGFLADFVAMLGEMGLTALRREHDHEALLESEEGFRRLAEDAPVYVTSYLPDGTLTYVNRAMGQLVGRRPESLIGGDLFELCDPAARDAIREALARLTPDHPIESHHQTYVTASGALGWQEWTNRAVFDPDGVPLRYQGVGQDVTERKQAEEASRQSQRLYETFINATDDMAFLKDDELRYIIVNQANAAFFGLSVDEVVGRTDADLMPAAGAESCRLTDQEALRDRTVVTSHEEVGGRIYETRKFQVQLDDDRVGVGGYVRDVTESTLAARALEERVIALTRPLEDPGTIAFDDLFDVADIQRLQDDFADATGVASVITRIDGTPITVPSNFCRLCKDIIRETDEGRANCFKSDAALGRLRADGPIIQPCLSGGLWDAGAGIAVGGRHIANWLIGQVRDETQTEDQMAAYAREIGVDEQRFIEAFREVPAMSQARFERVASALYSLASQLSTTAYQNVQQARFISEQRRAEAEVARLNADLERRVATRTAQLEATNKELESFAYSISHDLRAPLRALDGFSEILVEDYGDRLDDEGRAHLRRIRGAANHMSGLMDGLLQLSRLNREELQRQDVDVSVMTAEIVAGLRAEDPGRSVETSIAPGLVVEADPKLTRILLENLLSNAWKFTSRHPSARIEVGGERRDGAIACFVKDDGAGFDMRYAGNLFGAFQRLHTPDQFEGTGIGLATVQRIVNRHGGAVWAKGEVDQGATFWFTLESTAGAG